MKCPFGETYFQVSNEKNSGWLGYIGDYTAQLYRESLLTNLLLVSGSLRKKTEDALDQLTHLSGLIFRPVSLAYYQYLGDIKTFGTPLKVTVGWDGKQRTTKILRS